MTGAPGAGTPERELERGRLKDNLVAALLADVEAGHLLAKARRHRAQTEREAVKADAALKEFEAAYDRQQGGEG